jgi:hypothetical protein
MDVMTGKVQNLHVPRFQANPLERVDSRKITPTLLRSSCGSISETVKAKALFAALVSSVDAWRDDWKTEMIHAR